LSSSLFSKSQTSFPSAYSRLHWEQVVVSSRLPRSRWGSVEWTPLPISFALRTGSNLNLNCSGSMMALMREQQVCGVESLEVSECVFSRLWEEGLPLRSLEVEGCFHENPTC